MDKYTKTFDWIDFPQGRVRYAGGKRGRDEAPIHTFALEMHGRIFYGEIGELFREGGNDYDLEIISFGWLRHDWLGTEPDARYCASFALNELQEVQVLLCQAVVAWRNLDVRPVILTEYGSARFMGEVVFRDGWALIGNAEGGT